MSEPVTVHAPAKVNLALHVVGRRADGYHLIETLAVFTRLGDRIDVRPCAADRFRVEGPFAAALPDDGSNLVLRARDLLRDICGGGPVEIVLRKALPVASGIGGGSSDAAATLRALSRLWRFSGDEAGWRVRAAELGADLPMCLHAVPLVARGIGERIEPVACLPAGIGLVLVNPGAALSTPRVFSALRERKNPSLPPLGPAPLSFSGLCEWLGCTRNDLERPALAAAPAIGQALAALRGAGAALARMSGSGATCFGLFPGVERAQEAATRIAAAQPAWFVAATGLAHEERKADAA